MCRSPFWNDQSSFCLAFHEMVYDGDNREVTKSHPKGDDDIKFSID